MGQSTSLASGGRIIVGASALVSGQVSIPTTAGGTILLALNYRRVRLTIRNLDAANPIYIGEGPTVTTATGMLIKAGESIIYTYTGNLYAISTGGSVAVAYADEYTA